MGITFSGTYASTVTLSNPATDNPATITAAGRIATTNATGLNGQAGTAWTIDNRGSITVAGSAGFGVALASGGMLRNRMGGLIAGQNQGVYVTSQPVTLTNAGRISSVRSSAVESRLGGRLTNAATGTLSALTAGVDFGGLGTVVNLGSITASGSTAAGVNLRLGGVLTNSGSITTGGFALYAYGGAAEVTNSGVMTGAGGPAIVLHDGGSVVNEAGALIAGHYSAIHASNARGTVSNAGTISSDGSGIALDTGGTVSIAATGTVIALQGTGIGFGSGATVTNHGLVTATDNAIRLSAGGSVVNSGTLSGYSGIFSDGIEGFVTNSGSIHGTGNFGIRLNRGGTLTNLAGGVIDSGGIGVAVFKGFGTEGVGTVANAGTITSAGASPAVRLATHFANRVIVSPGAAFNGIVEGGNTLATGVASTLELAAGAQAGTITGFGSQYVGFFRLQADAGADWVLAGNNRLLGPMVLTNSGTVTVSGSLLTAGTILGGIGVAAGGRLANTGTISATGIAVSGSGGRVANLAGGTITGATGISFGAGRGTVFNAGTIIGTGGTAVQFGGGSGDRLVIHAGAVFGGAVDGGAGSDRLELADDPVPGAITGIGSAFTGFEVVALDDGAQWQVTGQNTLAAGTRFDIGAGATLTVAGTLGSAGSIRLGGGGLLAIAPGGAVATGAAAATAGALTVGTGTHLTAEGGITGNVIAAGLVKAVGALDISGTVSGSGTIQLAANALLSVSGALTAEDLAFLAGGGETLRLGTPAATSGTIHGFGATDTIDLLGIGVATSLGFADHVLTVNTAGGGLTLNFAGAYSLADFAFADDLHGGTMLTHS